ncbi:MAG TPA: VOC family protein [Smithellaceae bacterium]|nr:VOC family protein [Smithellaceae bacterium]
MNLKVKGIIGILVVALCLTLLSCLKPGEPKLLVAGIGVSDLESATDFYTRVVGMKVKHRIKHQTIDEVVLEFESGKGSDVSLMHYTDDSNPNYANNPVKLVFYVPDANAFAQALKDDGRTIITWPVVQPLFGNVVVGMARDRDGYLLEIVEDKTTTIPYLGAIGIGVSDLNASADFYTRVMGMQEKYRLTVPYFMKEVILEFESGKGSGVVLMNYFARKNYKNLPVKLVYAVTSPLETITAIGNENLEIILKPSPKFNPFNVGLARDPDGYLLEILQAVEEVKKDVRQ